MKEGAYNKIYVIVPVYNEERHILYLLNKLKKYTRNIIVVNDGSKDRTAQILSKIKFIKVVTLEKNAGKGEAMKRGANLAWRLGAAGLIFMDGDNQHNPKCLPVFFQSLQNNEDIILGIRILKANVPIYRKFGNKIVNILIQILFHVNVPDILCGYRAFSKRVYNKILWASSDYGVETEVVTLIGRRKLNYKLVVVDTVYLSKYKGFSIKDGVKIMLKLPYWRIRHL